MSRRERDKGRRGEREVASVYEDAGFAVRGLEGGGDHTVIVGPGERLRLHSEVKRQETARPWSWWAQAEAEAPPGAIPVVHFRRNASPWLVMLTLGDFVRLLAYAEHLTATPADDDKR